MKFRDLIKAIGASLVRYSDRPATSVTPENDLPAFLGVPLGERAHAADKAASDRAKLHAQLKERGYNPVMSSSVSMTGGPTTREVHDDAPPPSVVAMMKEIEHRMEGIKDELSKLDGDRYAQQALIEKTLDGIPNVQFLEEDEGVGFIVPPPVRPAPSSQSEPHAARIDVAMGHVIAPDGAITDIAPLTWDQINQTRAQLGEHPRWSMCKYPIRTRSSDYGLWMIGLVRDQFGVHNAPFHACHPIHDDVVLTSLTHLPTGKGIGLFADHDAAILAGDILASLTGLDWSRLDVDDPGAWEADMVSRVHAAWNAAGIGLADFHAHSYDRKGNVSDDELIVHQASQTASKPQKEKLQ